MVRQFNDGDVLYGSDLEHSIVQSTCLGLNNFLNAKKTSVDSGNTFFDAPSVHYGLNTNNINSGSTTLTTIDSKYISYGSVEGRFNNVTYWTSGSSNAVLSLSTNSFTASTSNTNNNSDFNVTPTATSELLGVGSTISFEISSTVTASTGNTAVNRIDLYDGSNAVNILNHNVNGGGNDSQTFKYLVKIVSSTTAKVYNMVTNALVSTPNISTLSLPINIKISGDATNPSNSSSFSTTFTKLNYHNSPSSTQLIVTSNEITDESLKSAIILPLLTSIDSNGDLIKYHQFYVSISTDGGSTFSGSVLSGLDVAEAAANGSNIVYKIYVDHIPGEPYWLDSWAALYDNNVSHLHDV